MGLLAMPGIVRSLAIRSTSSITTMAGWSERPIAAARPSAMDAWPDSSNVVRWGMRLQRYITESVLPVPGGPYRSRPRFR